MKRVCLFTLALSLLLAWGCAKKTEEVVVAPEPPKEEVLVVEDVTNSNIK